MKPPREPMDDKQRYMRWLEERWESYKFDFYGSTAHEDRRTEEVLEVLRGLGELSREILNPPGQPEPREEE